MNIMVMMSDRENFLRTLEFRNPEWIYCSLSFSPLTWHKYREKLEEIVLKYPRIFNELSIREVIPGWKNAESPFRKGSINFDDFPKVYKKGKFKDNWGCVWKNNLEGLEGLVVGHPLADWKALNTYNPPDFLTKTERDERNWKKIKYDIVSRRKKGLLTFGDGERLFDRLYFLRGFENLMIDFATDDPHLQKLIDMLTEYEVSLVNKWLEIGVDVIDFHTDIGTQNGLMISPEKFRKYIKPMYREIFSRVRKAGTHVLLSSDGCLLEIVDDLVECGVSMHDPQIRANTLEGIKRVYKGRMCINLDLDRQMFPFCKPEDIKEHIKQAIKELNSPDGGLMLQAGIFGDDVPLENIEAICKAYEEFCLR